MGAPPFVAEAVDGRVALVGDVEAHEQEQLIEVLDESSHGFRHDLLVDLSAVTFLPSSIVGALARAAAEATRNGTSLVLGVVERTVPHRVLEVCKIPYRVLT
ncbi:STAS domain-containing protein [Nocardioides sp. CPCC 205120]|uniref:STAS domain-containing protein n=1 Tax=Nocardioides sp. CPCC 205120 TaxID=3406462 RepID=UPI003B50ABAD